MKPPSPLSSPSEGRGVILVTHSGYAKVSQRRAELPFPLGAHTVLTGRDEGMGLLPPGVFLKIE